MTGDIRPRPFEVDADFLQTHLDDLVDATFSDLESQFLVLPKGTGFVEYGDFQHAYEVLKRYTSGFTILTERTTWEALQTDALAFIVLRTILGLSPPEWAELARTEEQTDVPQGALRGIEARCKVNHGYFTRLAAASNSVTRRRIDALLAVAVKVVGRGAPAEATDTVHRLNKVDTQHGLASLQYVAANHVPYAVLLYERYLGRPYASHRDAVSELVGYTMESAIAERLGRSGITFRAPARAERIPGWEQAPDFFVPDEFYPAVVIEAKIASDDGTARDKVARIRGLVDIRDERVRAGGSTFEVVACVDGRGFGVRREGMRQLIRATQGKVFTLRTIDRLITSTRLKDFLPNR